MFHPPRIADGWALVFAFTQGTSFILLKCWVRVDKIVEQVEKVEKAEEVGSAAHPKSPKHDAAHSSGSVRQLI